MFSPFVGSQGVHVQLPVASMLADSGKEREPDRNQRSSGRSLGDSGWGEHGHDGHHRMKMFCIFLYYVNLSC